MSFVSVFLAEFSVYMFVLVLSCRVSITFTFLFGGNLLYLHHIS